MNACLFCVADVSKIGVLEHSDQRYVDVSLGVHVPGVVCGLHVR